MTKKKIAISIDDDLLEIIDQRRGNEKRSTYVNSIISNHFKSVPEEKGGGTFVTTLELRKTLKPIHQKLLLIEGLAYDVKALQDLVKSK